MTKPIGRAPLHLDLRLTDHCDHPVIVDADGDTVASTSQDDGLEGAPLARLLIKTVNDYYAARPGGY